MPFVSRARFVGFGSAVAVLLSLTGCSLGRLIPSSGPLSIALHMQGKVHGGQQPVNGATIQLFDITEAQGNNLAAPLLTTVVMSDAGGAFNITGDYMCPNSADEVYLVATGGDAGSGQNADLVMMTALGPCGNLTASTFISVNEVTTVATVWTYADDWDPTQSGGSNIRFANGSDYQNFVNLVDPTTGVALATNGVNVQLQLNALGNSLSTCVNSVTDVNGDSPACDGLINLVGAQGLSTTSDSAAAVYAIAAYSSANAAGVFNYAPPSPPFQPTLSSAPSSWDLGFLY